MTHPTPTANLPQTIVLATGGTGGHVFPAQGVAHWLIAEGYKVIVITDKRGQKYTGWPKGVTLLTVGSPATRSFPLSVFSKISSILKNTYHVWRGFKHFKPSAVIGFGSFASFATLLAGWLKRMPVFIHEQNAVMGLANKLGSWLCKKVFLSFEHTQKAPAKKSIHTGLPLRSKFQKYKNISYMPPLHRDRFILTIVGGSQGAHKLGLLIPEAIQKLTTEQRNRLKIYHQVRADDVEAVKDFYRRIEVNATVQPFFENIESIFLQSHFVISRAGAGAVFELMFLKRPHLLIPLATAKHNHQALNATESVKQPNVWVMSEKTLTAIKVADFLDKVLQSPETLAKATKNHYYLCQDDSKNRILNTLKTYIGS